MFENLNVFKMAHAMAVHAGQKQAVAAENLANADTPGFKARTVSNFRDMYAETGVLDGPLLQKATRESHLNGSAGAQEIHAFEDKGAPSSPNGNSVSLENEMLKSLNAKRQHDRALAIYKSSMNVLRTALSRT